MRRVAMRWTGLVLLLAAGMAAGRPARVGGRQADAAAQALRELEARWLAFEDDPDSLEVYLADDFVHVLPGGFITKAEQIDWLRRHRPPGPAPRRRFDDVLVRVYGDVGIVNGVVVADSGRGGPPARTRFTDVFVRRGGRWQAVNAQETPEPPKPA